MKKLDQIDIRYSCDECAGFGCIPTDEHNVIECYHCDGRGWMDKPSVRRGVWVAESVMVDGVRYDRRRG